METKHTLSDVLARLTIDIANMNSFLFSLENMLESKSENINITQTQEDGTTYTISVPSFGYLKGKIEDINTKFETLLSANSDVIGIKSADGQVRKFELVKTSQLLADLENVSNSALTLPTEFRVRNNWFFESFLNPLLYVNIDIAGLLTSDIDQFSVKRVIINSVNNDDSEAYFDDNYKGRNDISLNDLIQDLDDNAIDYFIDDNTVDIGVAVNRFQGTFDVLRILEEEGLQTLTGGSQVSVVRRRYKLNSLTYSDILSDVDNTKILAEGDVLITANDSEYVVRSVNKTDTEVVLERIFGIDPITIGANELRLKPEPYREPELQVNVGFNERQIIFIRPISKAKNFTIDSFSNGFAIYTNDLTIPLEDDSVSTLASYYNNFVSDFGLILLNLAKERKLPAIIAETPSAPVINTSDFQVIQIDQHIQDDINVSNLKGSLKEKVEVQKNIQELNKKIDDVKSKINTKAKTQNEVRRLERTLTELQTERSEKTTNLSTLTNNITLQLSTTPQFITARKYAVRGFWQIPDPKSSRYGNQHVAQFKYRYRYLSQTGTQPKSQQQTFTEANGTKRSATFSPWIEKLTKPRVKELNPETGLYEWSIENVSDSDAVNTNQLEIPIRKGEIVEIQVKSLSEAGWPDNAVESEWSTSVQVAFPENISSEEESTIIAQQTFAEKSKLDFEQGLIARGLDTHLANQFTTGERFFAHKAQDISSGFFTTEGNVIDLFEQLSTIKATLNSIQQAIQVDAGVIKISIIDPNGSSVEVSNGDTISLFAGYYRDQIKDTTGGATVFNEGRIITQQYTLSIENTSATKLELISLLQGGIDELCIESDPAAYPDADYHRNRRYDVVPFAVNRNETPEIGDFKQIPSAQSGQVESQFIHTRIRNYGLSEELYAPSNPTTGYSALLDSLYDYQGKTIASIEVPTNWGHYLPYDPQYAGTFSTNAKVWNGQNTTSVPQGNGYLSEFCISKDHPNLPSLGVSFNIGSGTNLEDTFRPEFTSTNPTVVDSDAAQQILPFSHAIHFATSFSDKTNEFGVPYYKQASRITPVTPTDNSTRDDSHYPIKLGFVENDEFLIGKYTCGAYLYAYPLTYESVSVEGNFPARATKEVSTGVENSLNIPILFQYRCSDKLGYIGGFRTGTTLTNIKYQKKIGIDIFIKDQNPFSFDLEVAAQYTKETSLDAPLVQSKGTKTSF